MRAVEGELLRRMAAMPFIDRLEAAAVSGWSRGAVFDAVRSLEREGLAVSVPHASELIPPTRRHCLTAAGLHRLARAEGMTVDELLRLYPVSEQWRRILLERLDAVGVLYRLASAVSGAAFRSASAGTGRRRWTPRWDCPTAACSPSSGRAAPQTARPSRSGSGG